MTPITREQAETLANKHSVGSGGNWTVDLPALLTDFRQQIEAEHADAIVSLQAKHADEIAVMRAKMKARVLQGVSLFGQLMGALAKLEQSEARAGELEEALSACTTEEGPDQNELNDARRVLASLNKEPGHEA
jgi:hypothetical protein